MQPNNGLATPVAGGYHDAISDNVAAYVRQQFTEAVQYRAPVTDRIHRAALAMRCKYPPDMAAQVGEIDIYMGIIALKQRSTASWILDILANSIEKPWTIKATVLPDLPEDVEQIVLQRLVEEIQQFGLDPDQVELAADAMRGVAQKHINAIAEEGAKRLEQHIEDKLQQGNWVDEFTDFINDLCLYPYAVLSGPIQTLKTTVQYINGKPMAVPKAVSGVKRISPAHFYWSQDSTTTDNGKYVIEHGNMSFTDLEDARRLPGFNAEAIDQILQWEAKNDYTLNEYGIEQAEKGLYGGYRNQTGGFDVIKYYGKIPRRLLDSKNTTRGYIEAEVWVIGSIAIRNIGNPDPTGGRPFYKTSMVKVPGSFAGQGLYDILWHIERAANAAVRNLIKNMSFSAGPIGEYAPGRMVDDQELITEVVPYTMYQVEEDEYGSGSAPVFRFHQVNSNAGELMDIYDRFKRMADEISGIPQYALGNLDMAGVARTASGLSMLMGNAAKGIKLIINHIDKDIISKVIESFYYWELLHNDDPSIKVDAQVIARGASGILQKELSQSKMFELLQLITPYAQAGIIPPEGVSQILREVIKAGGYDADAIMPAVDRGQDLVHAMQQAMGGQAPTQGQIGQGTPQGNPLAPQASATPASDGRFIQAPQSQIG